MEVLVKRPVGPLLAKVEPRLNVTISRKASFASCDKGYFSMNSSSARIEPNCVAHRYAWAASDCAPTFVGVVTDKAIIDASAVLSKTIQFVIRAIDYFQNKAICANNNTDILKK